MIYELYLWIETLLNSIAVYSDKYPFLILLSLVLVSILGCSFFATFDFGNMFSCIFPGVMISVFIYLLVFL